MKDNDLLLNQTTNPKKGHKQIFFLYPDETFQGREMLQGDLSSNSIIGGNNINYSTVSPSGKKRTNTTDIGQAPQSPGQRLLYVASSPARYVKKQIRPGGIKSSIFSLIILCLGAGTLSMPYVFYENGIVCGIILLLIGAGLSLYTGWLVVICCNRLNASRYEDIAFGTYGKKASIITSCCMLACLIGFVMSYIVLFKELMPYTLQRLAGVENPLPDVISGSFAGKTFWAAIFSFFLVFPVSLARTLSALRFSSFFSFIISLYIVAAIVFLCLVSREVTPDLGQSFKVAIENFDLSVMGVFNSLPLVIFSYMYQTNIPMIYVELEKKVMLYGTIGATVAYIFAGVFGYTAFATNSKVDELMNIQNILKCYPDNPANFISLFGILIVILFATPLTILPCKDTIEELFLKPGQRLTSKQNIVCTFILVAISFAISLAIPKIGDAMTILGATTNSAIGFLFPIIYYLKIERKAPRWARHKVIAYIVFAFVFLSSIIELGTFIYKKANGIDT